MILIFYRGDFRLNVMSRTTQANYAHRNIQHGDLSPPLSAFLTLPCFTCYSPYHSTSNCGGRNGAFHVQHHREFTGMPIAPPHVSGSTYNHLDVAGRMQHVSELAESLVATTARLKVDGDRLPC